jgi:hypothetical protein
MDQLTQFKLRANGNTRPITKLQKLIYPHFIARVNKLHRRVTQEAKQTTTNGSSGVYDDRLHDNDCPA